MPFLNLFVIVACQRRKDLTIRLRSGVPCSDKGYWDQTSCDFPISGPWRRPDRVDRRQPPAQHGRRAARLARQSIDALALDTHVRERLLERRIAEQVDGTVRFAIDGIAGPHHDAVPLPVQRDNLALGLLGVNDRNEGRGRLRHCSQRVRRLEDDGLIVVVAGHVFVSQEACNEREGFLSGIGGDGEGAVGSRRLEPCLEILQVSGYRRREDGGGHRRVAGGDPSIPEMSERPEAFRGYLATRWRARSAARSSFPATARDHSHRAPLPPSSRQRPPCCEPTRSCLPSCAA